MDSKLCSKCKTLKPLVDFSSNGKAPDGSRRYRSACNACERLRNKLKPTYQAKLEQGKAKREVERLAKAIKKAERLEKAKGPHIVEPLCDFKIIDTYGYGFTGCHESLCSTQNGYPMLARKDALDRFHHRHIMAVIHGADSLKGKHVHHKCFNPLCVNPAHLEVLTPHEHTEVHKLEDIKNDLDDIETIRQGLKMFPDANRSSLAALCNIDYTRLCKLVKEENLQVSRKWER